MATLVGLGSTRAEAQTLLHLHADRIAFYYDRFLVEADGHVRIQTSDGTTITGDTFTMDLKLNRFMIAGHVTLRDATGNLSGAALADFISFKRVYFIPVTSAPDRWTYLNGDYSHPAKGRIMPGDTFAFPDLAHSDVSLTASRRPSQRSRSFASPVSLPICSASRRRCRRST